MLLKILQEIIFNKIAGVRATQVFSTEICEIFKNIYFSENLYLHVTLLTMYEKGTANEAKLGSFQTYMMEFVVKTVKAFSS